ncbi:hypothetical protein C440_09993 [Haloferax mucosum ATCC BAA-1512]|uniref:CARDB domain-containing protein n=1 Tax=Haloferax mucosum ATCC BAA-1512 TaxID=662479 RepID=M0ICN6_9EURY|nr:hypothetical protein [Haloferax mucosum]ELZ94501.1 hypothetical protein C440_09993 [Haloferax mucosum ATCC BAA-1512]
MSSEQPNSGGLGVLSWFFVGVIVLSTVVVPIATGPAKAAEAHLGITDVELSPDEPAPGQQTELNTVIRNGKNSPTVVEITDLYVRRQGSSNDIARIEDVGTITIGGNISVPLTVSFEKPGLKNLRVILVGQKRGGSHVRVQYPVTVHVKEPSRPQLELSAEEAVPGATRSVNVTVSNGLNHDIRQLRLVSSSPAVNFSVNERVKPQLGAGDSATFEFPARVSNSGSHPVNLTLHYADRGVKHEVTRTYHPNFDSPTNPGKVLLTDVQATQAGGSLEISATAGNVGSSTVDGVVVSVAESEQVEGSKYFVGSVEKSDFSSFTLRSDVSGNVSSVPVKVRYTVGGVEKSFTKDVNVDRQSVGPQLSNGGGGGLPLLPVGGAAVLLLIGAVVYVRKR